MYARILLNGLFTGLMTAAGLAAASEEGKKFESELEVGIITTSGNTNTESYKGRLEAEHELEHWRNTYILEGLSKTDELVSTDDAGNTTKVDQTTAEKYFGSVQTDYKLNDEDKALFAYAEYSRDRFSGFDYQYTVAAGYSDRFFKTDNSSMTYSIGPGYTVDKPEPLAGVGQEKEETPVARISAEYLYQISENAKFTQKVSSNYALKSDRNSKTRATSAVTAKILSRLALRASFTLVYNTEIPEAREHADRETSLTAVYNF